MSFVETRASQGDDKGIPSESRESSRMHFVEPLLGKNEAAKMKDINIDKLTVKNDKGVEHFAARKSPTDSQMPSSSGQTTKPNELVKKTECVKGKTPGIQSHLCLCLKLHLTWLTQP